jgi:CRP-like cAMP-binding protein
MSLVLSLTSIPVFSFLTPADAQKLQPIARAVTKTQGEAIVLHDEPVAAIYIVAEGRCGVYPPGAPKALAELKPGDAFGEMSFLEKSRASATIRAEEKVTRLAVVPHADLEKLLAAEPQVAAGFYRGAALVLSKKLRATTGQIAAELKTGRQLLSELSADMGGGLAFDDLPALVEREARGFERDLGATLKEIEDLARKVPEKAAFMTALATSVSDANVRLRSFHGRLGEKVAVMTRFIKAVEAFVLESHP